MLTNLCLCAFALFADPNWSRLDTTFLDMDPPMLSWSMTDAEYLEWEEAEYEQLDGSQLHGELVTGGTDRDGLDALQMVRDCHTGYVLGGTRAQRTVPALAR